MKNKFLISLIISVVLISVFSISCFAYDVEPDKEYTFKEDIDPSMFNFSSSVTLDTAFVVRDYTGNIYQGMTMSYRGYYVLTYDDSVNDITVWDSDSGWVDDKYRNLLFIDGFESSEPFSSFLEDNEYIAIFSPYGTIYSLISEHLFVGFMEDDFVRLSVTFLAVLLTMGVFIVPFAVSYGVFKMIITAIDRSI